MLTEKHIYILWNTVTGKIYVGSSTNPKRRYLDHIYALHGKRHWVEDMQSDYDEYGNHFKFIVVDYIHDLSERHKEYEWMRKLESYKRNYGYNYNDIHLIEVKDRTKYYYDFQGKKCSISEIAKESKISAEVIRNRVLTLGWSIEKAISVPVKGYRNCR